MKTNEIKTKRALQQVALEVVTSVRNALSWDEQAIIDVRKGDNYFTIEVSENDIILTSVFLKHVINAVDEFKTKYPLNVAYGMETSEYYAENLHQFVPKPLFYVQLRMYK